mgnify:CR=1 FL=1
MNLPGKNTSGSPPRMRGTRYCRRDPAGLEGFTPAYAGNTRSLRLTNRSFWVHPRVCGEHGNRDVLLERAWGSPPRTRGTRQPRWGRALTVRVHPRVCGEHPPYIRVGSAIRGSPPRMRGTRVSPETEDTRERFTPAYAGNTRCGR